MLNDGGSARADERGNERNDARPLEEIIAALRLPEAYDHPVFDIVVIQTHVSYVVLAGDYAYKIKKPLSLGFLDYGTLELRQRMCEEEVRLNRRLCEGVYLGVTPITRQGSGYRVGGAGKVVEYAVKMRRLRHERMLDEMVRNRDEAVTEVVHRVGETMAGFHRDTATDEHISAFGRIEALATNWNENVRQLDPYAGALFESEDIAKLDAYGERTRNEDLPVFNARVESGRTRDCHGDLRADAVYVRPDGDVCILDTIEFNERIRFGDVAGDVGFLAMDLEFRDRVDLSDELMATYLAAAPDETLPLVLNYYKTYRAIVRAKVEAMRWSEAEVPPDAREEAGAAARRYMDLALDYAGRSPRPVLAYMVGLSATGKSFVAGALACRLQAAIVGTDVVRKADLPRSGEMYDPRERARVYDVMRERAAAYLSQGRPVVLDATHIKRAQRDAARELAKAHGVPALGIELRASDGVVRERFAERARIGLSPSDASWDVYNQQRDEMDAIAPDEGDIVRLPDNAPLSRAIEIVLGALEGGNAREL